MSVFVRHPPLPLLPAMLWAGFARRGRDPLAGIAALSWLIYAVYELLMKYRVLCSGECDIRVDLLAIYPALLVVSVVGIVFGLV